MTKTEMISMSVKPCCPLSFRIVYLHPQMLKNVLSLNGKITCMRLVIESFSSIEYLVIQVKAFDIRVQRYSQNILAVSS